MYYATQAVNPGSWLIRGITIARVLVIEDSPVYLLRRG